MRILAISDLRVQRLSDVEAVVDAVKPELVLYAGDDVARFGPGPDSWSRLALSVPHGLAGVIGNDCLADARAVLRQPGCHDLHKEPLLIGELAILGLQGAPAAGGLGIGSTLYSDDESRHHLDRQRRAVGARPIILVSHAPPQGILDLAVRFGLENIGAVAVLEATRWPSLRAVVCGHVHLQGGRHVREGECVIVNCASHDGPEAPLRFAVLTWDGREIVATTHVHDARGSFGELPGMQRRHAKALQQAGVTTVAEAADLGIAGLRDIVGGYAPRYWLLAKARVERRPVFRSEPMPIARDALFVDVETSLDPSDVWMVAVASATSGVEQFVEIEPSKQQRLLTALDKRVRSLSPSQFLQWSAFDRNALERAYGRHRRLLPSWLSRDLWVDARWWTDRAFALPFWSRTIKDVAAYFGYEYAESQLNGLTVGLWYGLFLTQRKPFDVPRVRVYNRDDVEALRRVVRSILALAKTEPRLPPLPQTDAQRSKLATKPYRRPPSSAESEVLVAKAIAGFKAAIRRQVSAGTFNPRCAAATVSRYAVAMRRHYGLPASAKTG